MPELPEVETVMQGMRTHWLGERIKSVTLRRPNIRFPIPPALPTVLANQPIHTLTRRSKYILVHIGDQALILHLGMSGRILFETKTTDYDKHDHVIFTLKSSEIETRFRDPRRFGIVTLSAWDAVNDHPLLRDIGPEPFDNTSFTAQYFTKKLEKSRSPIKTLLLNQKIVAGVGNIYASEALFRARIHPEQQGKDLTSSQIKRLIPAIQQTLQDAIDSGGSSLRDYVQTNGELGYFQHCFDVYDRAEQPCKNCGTLINRKVHSNRATYFCPTCQPLDA